MAIVYNALSKRNLISHKPHAYVYIRDQNWSCAQLHGLCDWIVQQILIYVSSSWLCDSEALASPLSEDCCHDTSARNVYIGGWQEIMKLKAIELRVLFSSLVGTDTIWSARVYVYNMFLVVQAISAA